MKKKHLMLPCIAAVAIATFVGAKFFQTNASERSSLLLTNVEALSNGEDNGDWRSSYSMKQVWYRATVGGGIKISLDKPRLFASFGATWNSLSCCMSSVEANACDFKKEDSKCKNTINRNG